MFHRWIHSRSPNLSRHLNISDATTVRNDLPNQRIQVLRNRVRPRVLVRQLDPQLPNPRITMQHGLQRRQHAEMRRRKPPLRRLRRQLEADFLRQAELRRLEPARLLHGFYGEAQSSHLGFSRRLRRRCQRHCCQLRPGLSGEGFHLLWCRVLLGVLR
jgi:hypothetical protein